MHAFDVLGDPVRRRILELLASGEHSSGEIVAIAQRDSGFATVRIDGARRLYTVDAAPMKEVDTWLDQFRRFWERRLDALATEVARGKRKPRVPKVRTGA
jgi:hypothetical protein